MLPANRVVNESQPRTVAASPVKLKVYKFNAAVRADRAVRAVAIIAAAILMECDSAMLLPIKNRSVVSVDRHYGVSPPPLSGSSGQSVRGMQLELPPVATGDPHGSVYIVSVL